jgi:predicted dehydrogenase
VSRVLVARGVDTPDVIQASVRFLNGAIASFESSWIMPNTFPAFTDSYLHVMGSQGTVFLDRGREAPEIFSTQSVKYPKLSTVYEHEGRIYGSFRHALEHFVDCALTGAAPLTSAARVYGVVAALEAIHQSLETRQPVAVKVPALVGA